MADSEEQPAKKQRIETEEEKKVEVPEPVVKPDEEVKDEVQSDGKTIEPVDGKEEVQDEVSDLTMAKILKQIDFYFSDSNYPTDNFLLNKAKENADGYIPLTVLLTFNRLKVLSKDPKVLAQSIQNSTVVELNEDNTMLRRIKPLLEDIAINKRSIYAKGFDREVSTIESIGKYFEEKGYIVLSVRMRRWPRNKKFKGTCYVEFDTEDNAKKALEEKHLVGDKELIVLTKDAHIAELAEQKKKAHTKKEQKSEKDAIAEALKLEEERAKREYPKGTILRLKTVGPECSRELLREIFGDCGKILHVDYSRGEPDGKLRFEDAESASKALKLITEQKVEVSGVVPEADVLEGEEELNTWHLVWDWQEQFKKDKKRKGNFGRRGGRGGRGKGRGGRGGFNKRRRKNRDDD